MVACASSASHAETASPMVSSLKESLTRKRRGLPGAIAAVTSTKMLGQIPNQALYALGMMSGRCRAIGSPDDPRRHPGRERVLIAPVLRTKKVNTVRHRRYFCSIYIGGIVGACTSPPERFFRPELECPPSDICRVPKIGTSENS